MSINSLTKQLFASEFSCTSTTAVDSCVFMHIFCWPSHVCAVQQYFARSLCSLPLTLAFCMDISPSFLSWIQKKQNSPQYACSNAVRTPLHSIWYLCSTTVIKRSYCIPKTCGYSSPTPNPRPHAHARTSPLLFSLKRVGLVGLVKAILHFLLHFVKAFARGTLQTEVERHARIVNLTNFWIWPWESNQLLPFWFASSLRLVSSRVSMSAVFACDLWKCNMRAKKNFLQI